jgi:hypothetical protein
LLLLLLLLLVILLLPNLAPLSSGRILSVAAVQYDAGWLLLRLCLS